jgi:hypothetical protein
MYAINMWQQRTAVIVFERRNLESLPGSPVYDEDNSGISYMGGGGGANYEEGVLLLPRTTRRRQEYNLYYNVGNTASVRDANESVHKKLPEDVCRRATCADE